MNYKLKNRNNVSNINRIIFVVISVLILSIRVGYSKVITSLGMNGNIDFDNNAICVPQAICNNGWCYIDEDCNKLLTIGEEVYKGDEHFYYIIDDGTNVRLLAKYNLRVSSGVAQMKQMTSQEPKSDYYLVFSKSEYWRCASATSKIYALGNCFDSSGYYADLNSQSGTNATAINAATSYASSVGALKGTLLTFEEAQNLLSKPELYEIILGRYGKSVSLNYWLSSAYYSGRVWHIYLDSAGVSLNHSAYFDTINGVRPVISVAKSTIQK